MNNEFFILSTVIEGKRSFVMINEENGKVNFGNEKELAIRFDDRQKAKKFSLEKVKRLCMITKINDKIATF